MDLSFDYERVQQLLISKYDPETQDQWTARVQKVSPRRWRFASAPHELGDSLANGTFIEHLLDTLNTLKKNSPAPAATLKSYGLEPPRFTLQWSTPEQTYEIQLGDPASASVAALQSDPNDIGQAFYAYLPQLKKVVLAKGAALTMLRFLKTFDDLRQKNLVTLESDQIQSVQIRKSKKLILQAERISGRWVAKRVDGTSHKSTPRFQEWLDQFTHIKVQNFIDGLPNSKKQALETQSHSGFEVTLKTALYPASTDLRPNEQKSEQKIWIRETEHQIVASTSDRSGSTLQLFPETLRILNRF